MTTNFNTDELEAPEWMNNTFFERALRSYEHDNDVSVKNFTTQPATKVGDHFASIMFRVVIEYDSPKYKKYGEKLQVIVKSMPVTKSQKSDFLEQIPAFKTEIKMYTKVIPEMERVLSSVGDATIIGPRLIFATFDPIPVLVLEDISVTGYEMVEKPIDYEGAKLVAHRIAKFHAASIYIQANGMDLTCFNETLMTVKMPELGGTMLDTFMVPTFDLLVDVMKTWHGDWENIIQKLEKCKLTFADKVRNVYLGKNERIFSVLNHSDFHYKNMMFIKEDGIVKDLLLLDFQFCLWGTCAIDLSYLFYMISNASARERRMDLLQYYYDEFESTLKKLGYSGRIPTLHDFNIEILRNGIVEVLLCVSMLMFQYMDFSNMTTEEVWDTKDPFALHRITMKNPEYQKALKKELPRLVALGLIE
uniref:CSON010227 protein n=1 Tax=Culicoides sonorensis TaxID=179676 RepID=A0A336MZ52_CULSO